MQTANFAVAALARHPRPHSQTPSAHDAASPTREEPRFPDAERAARHAVQIWFSGKVETSLIDFRNERCREHCERHDDGALRHHMRMTAFERAYAEEVGRIIVERRYVRPIT